MAGKIKSSHNFLIDLRAVFSKGITGVDSSGLFFMVSGIILGGGQDKMNIPFFSKLKLGGLVGVDIGTTSIKAVEMSKEGGRFKLLNYGFSEIESQEKTMQTNQKAGKLPDEYIISRLREVFARAKFKSKRVVASIPSFSTLSTVISLPYLSEKDLARTIPFEAKKYVPIPLSEVVLDWSIIKAPSSIKKGGQGQDLPPTVDVFLAAVPKSETERYKKIMISSGLDLAALELENIALTRSLVGNDLSPLAIVNIGGRSTSIVVIEGGFERVSHNYEMGGFEITKSIAYSMGVSFARAEELKKTVGFSSDSAQIVGEGLVSLMDMMVFETKKTITNFETTNNTKVQKIILVGGLVNMPGFLDYFKKKVGLEIIMGNPLARLIYPPELKNIVGELGTSLSVAIGLAMREV